MGDMADFALEETEDGEDAYTLWALGEMSYQEAFERGIIDELGRDLRTVQGIMPL